MVLHRCFAGRGLDLEFPALLSITNTILHGEVILCELLGRSSTLRFADTTLGSDLVATILTLQAVEEVMSRIFLAKADPEAEETIIEQALVHTALLDLPLNLLD